MGLLIIGRPQISSASIRPAHTLTAVLHTFHSPITSSASHKLPSYLKTRKRASYRTHGTSPGVIPFIHPQRPDKPPLHPIELTFDAPRQSHNYDSRGALRLISVSEPSLYRVSKSWTEYSAPTVTPFCV